MHKRDAWVGAQLKNFIEGFKYFDSNLPGVLVPAAFYANGDVFLVESELLEESFVGLNVSEALKSQVEFLLKAYAKFLNAHRDSLEQLSRIFPLLASLFFSPGNLLYHFKSRELRCDFSRAVPLLLMGGRASRDHRLQGGDAQEPGQLFPRANALYAAGVLQGEAPRGVGGLPNGRLSDLFQ